MQDRDLRRLSRRELLAASVGLGAAFTVGAGFVTGRGAAWAVEVTALKPATMATLIQMARDIYPHDRIADEFYAIAVKAHDTAAAKSTDHLALIEGGIADLDAKAGPGGYLGIGWEKDRVALLRRIEGSAFFQTVRGGLVTGLYNQKAVWPVFGYEGESFSKGGYIERGFDDIAWL